MTIKDDEAKVKADYDQLMAQINGTEATWLAWAKANKVKVILGAIALVIAIVVIVKAV